MAQRYLTVISERDGLWQAEFPGFEQMTVTAQSREALLERLPTELRDHLHQLRLDGAPVPVLAPVQVAEGGTFIAVSPADNVFHEKASEKLADFAKAEYDRLVATGKLAEDRARANGTLALAVIPVLTFLRPASADLIDKRLFAACFVLILTVMVLTGLAVMTRKLRGVSFSSEEFEHEANAVYEMQRTTRDMLYLIQSAWVSGIKQLHTINTTRFRLVLIQQVLLLVLIVLVSTVVYRSL